MLPADPKVVALAARTEEGMTDLSFLTEEQMETAMAKIRIEQGL